jgi:hypothetical protein
VSRLPLALGIILILGGVGHTAGVIRLHVADGLPEFNRVLLDAWVAEAQILAGAFYVASYRARRAGSPWRSSSIAGALMLLAYAVPYIPVLFMRAPLMFLLPPIAYAALSVMILARALHRPERSHRSLDDPRGSGRAPA